MTALQRVDRKCCASTRFSSIRTKAVCVCAEMQSINYFADKYLRNRLDCTQSNAPLTT